MFVLLRPRFDNESENEVYECDNFFRFVEVEL